jgi:hypothetical protein
VIYRLAAITRLGEPGEPLGGKTGKTGARRNIPRFFGGSLVSVLAVTDAGDFDGIAEIPENYAVVLSAEAVERRLDALQALDVAFLGLEESGQSAKDLHRGGLWDGAEVGLGLIG